MHPTNTIIITLHYRNEATIVQVRSNQYHSLMTLISDTLAIPGFGLCCGMGSCGTCLVKIGSDILSAKRNVLACDIRINDELANAHVIIPDQF